MQRRMFLIGASTAGIVACTGASPPTGEVQPTLPDAIEVYLIDAETPFADTGRPYLQALRDAPVGLAPGITWEVLPDYGREHGTTVRGAVVARAEDRARLERYFAELSPPWILPPSQAIRVRSRPDGWDAVVVSVPAVLTPDDIVAVEPGDEGMWLELAPDASERFESFSASNVGRRLAIVMDGEVVADPIVNEAIGGGRIAVTLRG